MYWESTCTVKWDFDRLKLSILIFTTNTRKFLLNKNKRSKDEMSMESMRAFAPIK